MDIKSNLHFATHSSESFPNSGSSTNSSSSVCTLEIRFHRLANSPRNSPRPSTAWLKYLLWRNYPLRGSPHHTAPTGKRNTLTGRQRQRSHTGNIKCEKLNEGCRYFPFSTQHPWTKLSSGSSLSTERWTRSCLLTSQPCRETTIFSSDCSRVFWPVKHLAVSTAYLQYFGMCWEPNHFLAARTNFLDFSHRRVPWRMGWRGNPR